MEGGRCHFHEVMCQLRDVPAYNGSIKAFLLVFYVSTFFEINTKPDGLVSGTSQLTPSNDKHGLETCIQYKSLVSSVSTAL